MGETDGEIPVEELKPDTQGSIQYVHESAVSEWKWRSFVNKLTWGLIVILAPFTVAVIISQNSIPGDMLYPLKRSLENMVLAAAVMSPATRAAFRTDLVDRRFSEAEKLLLARNDAAGLTDFLSEVEQTQIALTQVTNQKQKEELTQKLIVLIDKYQTSLTKVQAQLQAQELASTSSLNPSPDQSAPTSSVGPSVSELHPTNSSSQVVLPTTNSVPSPTRTSGLPTAGISPTLVVSRITPTVGPQAAIVPTRTPTRVPSLVPTPTPTPTTPVGGAIDRTKEDLERIRRELERQQHQSASQSINSQSAAQSVKSEKQQEKKEQKEQKEEKKDKSDTDTTNPD